MPLILGYKGMIELAKRGDGVKQIEPHAVYAGDMSEYGIWHELIPSSTFQLKKTMAN